MKRETSFFLPSQPSHMAHLGHGTWITCIHEEPTPSKMSFLKLELAHGTCWALVSYRLISFFIITSRNKPYLIIKLLDNAI